MVKTTSYKNLPSQAIKKTLVTFGNTGNVQKMIEYGQMSFRQYLKVLGKKLVII